MNEDKIWHSITRSLTGEIDNEEKSAVDDWCKKNGNRKIYSILSEIWGYNPARIIDTSTIYTKFQQKKSAHVYNQNPSSPILWYALRISAVLFLLISTIVLVNKYLPIGKSGTIVYQEIYVPKGNRTSFILPDGSKVWLSNNSKIKYPNEFDKELRELELTGEAYFEVLHDDNKPFIVTIGKNRIKVLGTKFSVTAYPEDNIVRTELVSGRILFQVHSGKDDNHYTSYEVKPLHSLVLDKTSGKLFDSEIPEGFYNYWQNGIYEFTNESLESLAQKIDRIYNMQIVFEDNSLKTKRFSGVISINDNIFTFMEAIKRTSVVPIEYRYDSNKIFIKRNIKK